MIIKKLPIEIQSLLNASAKINNYKNAVEELVYNSLDADATSIAIRIHIYENIIQVIDNGFGITKCDIPLLGQRYASSKVTDASSLKGAPNKFGFRGESLSNIIDVSQCVKITTRHKDTEETWVKSFYKGQPKQSQVTVMRPSKGTTVEVKGFLYNLHIQKKATNPLNELQCIKLFLQQISLVNTNVSISLRDDSKNEIIFKVHKNRDVYQTLSSLYGINKKDLQELQIEKHQYKAKGFIGRQSVESNSNRWIYLNGRFIHKCALHDIINSTFTKNKQQCRNVKAKNNVYNFEKEKQNYENEIPTYFIFITCPHLDYDINVTSTKTIVEFKDWIQIKHMLEKLVQFYKGDIKLKKIDVNENERKNKIENTREEVRKIMEKVLGNPIKNQRITQLHKSVKGKTAKKKKTKSRKIQKLKNIHKFAKESTKIDHNINVCIDNPSSITKEVPVRINYQIPKTKYAKTDHEIENHGVINQAVRSKKKMRKNEINPIQQNEKNKNTVNIIDQEITDFNVSSRQENTSMINNTTINNHIPMASNVNRENQIVKRERTKSKPLKSNEKRKLKAKQKNDFRIKKYLKEKQFKLYRENLKKKIDKKMNEVLDTAHNNCIKADQVLFENRNNHSLHENKKFSFTANSVACLEKVKKDYLKSSDLLKTILNSQKNYNSLNENDVRFQNSRNPFEMKHCQNTVELEKKSYKRGNNYYVNNGHSKNIQESYKNDYERRYEDHFHTHDYFHKKYNHIGRDISQNQNTAKPNFNFDHYNPNQSITYINNIETNISTHIYKSFSKLTFESHKYNAKDVFLEKNKKLERFITEQSKENFNLQNIKYSINVTSSNFNQHTNFSNKRKNLRKHPYVKSVKNVAYFEHKSSHTIEFNINNARENETLDQWNYRVKSNIHNTYTILDSNVSLNITNYNTNTVYHQETVASYLRYNLNYAKDKENDKSKVEQNIINSEIQLSQKTNDSIEPINLCEAVYHNSNDYRNDKNNLNIQTEITIKDNTNDLARNKTDDVYQNDSCNIKRDVMSRYFLSSDNSQDLPNDKEKGEEYQNDENYSDDNIRVGDDNFLPINEEIDKSHFETESQILKMNESIKLNNEQSEDKQIRNDEKEKDNDSTCPNVTRIDNDNLKEIIETAISRLQTDKCTEMQIENCKSVNKQLQDGEIINNNEDKKNKFNSFQSVVCESISNLKNNENFKICDFKIQNRLSFVPKGMSPIFDNCNNKNICSYNLDTDYYQDDVYNNFATEILENIKIFENKVSNMNDVSEKMNTDNNCLKFDAESLKNAKVFGQVDRKFIVAEVRSDNLKHLVLFDQHAVHERIRLEKNLSDYKDGDQWNGINCETLSLTLPKNTVLYLNNFRDRFKQLGLDWKIESDCSITINSIPKAVFGKNYRQADVIIQAIKKLILEEIKAIKSLGDNTLLYPKSLMNLVFSEACRYAIKFGDKLSKRECATLISSLSSCKTPFQCAHGRPVLAVLSDLRTYSNQYKVDTSKILSFTNKLI